MAELGDENMETAGIEEAVIAPELQENILALYHIVLVFDISAEPSLRIFFRDFHWFIV